MLRASLLANVEILPQARQGSYFFNRIGQKQSVMAKNNSKLFLALSVLLRFQYLQWIRESLTKLSEVAKRERQIDCGYRLHHDGSSHSLDW